MDWEWRDLKLLILKDFLNVKRDEKFFGDKRGRGDAPAGARLRPQEKGEF
ncbi:hypothetical protein [Pseudomonas sp. GW456-12-1-14-TSB6]|nr:hypothetical protein [Pseudomonas sp. GW456-12-1-14-TSB6]